MEVITDSEEIYYARIQLIENFADGARCVKTETGNKGGNSYPVVFWREDLNIWLDVWRHYQPAKYGLGWGTADPTKARYVKQIIQTNVQAVGYYLELGSTFVKDSQGKIYLTHNGKIGGGSRRIGPDLFWANYQGKSETIEYPRGETRKIVKIKLASSFPKEIARFVHEVARIKQIGKR